MFATIVEGLKTILGLSGIAYIAGFIIANASFLSWGVSEANLLDAKYVAAGAIFLFLGVPVIIFPYLRGLASLCARYRSVTGSFVSNKFQTFYDDNKAFFTRIVGPYLVIAAVIVFLPELASNRWKANKVLPFMTIFTAWYVSSYLCSRLAAIIFNMSFYWRINMVGANNIFWKSFKKSFYKKFIASFEKSSEFTAGKRPVQAETQAALNKYVGEGLSSNGFVASALYKGVALFFLNAVIFGWFLYPLVPASIGGGRNEAVVLLLSSDKSTGLIELGLRGNRIKVEGKDTKGPTFQLLTTPMPLLVKTSEAYFVLVKDTSGTGVVKIPLSSVEGVFYGNTK